jgi:hypothetical protein
VGAASCRERLKGEEQASRGDAANAAKGETQGPMACADAHKDRPKGFVIEFTRRSRKNSVISATRAKIGCKA